MENKRQFNRGGHGHGRPQFARGGSKGPFRHAGQSQSGGQSYGHGGGHGGNAGPRRFFKGAPKKGGFRSTFDHARYINKPVTTEEVAVYKPEHTFADFDVNQSLKRNIELKGYINPTPIQDHSINHILAGKDLVGIANTGTGKTGAFLIPTINTVMHDRNKRVLVMVPTRELAIQIADEFRGLAKDLRLYATVCVGGASIGPQLGDLRRNPQFVIGTPGRLKDLIERRALDLSKFSVAVLDEADRMLDMGFIHDMKKILALLPESRQTLFFSATLSTDIEKLIGQFLREPVRIKVATRETAASIEQDVIMVPRGTDKIDLLHDLLIKPGFDKVLIFGRTKHGVDRLAKKLVQRGFKAESIHGNKTQNRRQKALQLFKQDHVQVLVATDVAARGLDIAGVSHVINFDLPNTNEDYVHRIGRTGRAGKRGIALTFIEQ